VANRPAAHAHAEWSCLAYALTSAEIALMWQAAPEPCGDVDPMPDYENVLTD
jgi:hypothetical protein